MPTFNTTLTTGSLNRPQELMDWVATQAASVSGISLVVNDYDDGNHIRKVLKFEPAGKTPFYVQMRRPKANFNGYDDYVYFYVSEDYDVTTNKSRYDIYRGGESLTNNLDGYYYTAYTGTVTEGRYGNQIRTSNGGSGLDLRTQNYAQLVVSPSELRLANRIPSLTSGQFTNGNVILIGFADSLVYNASVNDPYPLFAVQVDGSIQTVGFTRCPVVNVSVSHQWGYYTDRVSNAYTTPARVHTYDKFSGTNSAYVTRMYIAKSAANSGTGSTYANSGFIRAILPDVVFAVETDATWGDTVTVDGSTYQYYGRSSYWYRIS